MARLNRHLLILPLAVCLLLMPALAGPTIVAHEAQHAHHHAATHSSPLCSWFCGAGQGIEVVSPVLVPTSTFVAVLYVESADQVDDAVSMSFFSRGPPSF